MIVKELLECLPQDKEIDIRFFWIPSKKYVKDEETGEWLYRDGNAFISLSLSEEKLNAPNFNPNRLEEDEEYGFIGTPEEFYSLVDEYGEWILYEEIFAVGDRQYGIEKYSI